MDLIGDVYAKDLNQMEKIRCNVGPLASKVGANYKSFFAIHT